MYRFEVSKAKHNLGKTTLGTGVKKHQMYVSKISWKKIKNGKTYLCCIFLGLSSAQELPNLRRPFLA